MQARLSNILSYFVTQMNIDFNSYADGVGAFLTQGEYTTSSAGNTLVNNKGFIGRYQLSMKVLMELGLTNNSSQDKNSVLSTNSWVQTTTGGAVDNELLSPVFNNAAIFSLPDTPVLVPADPLAFLNDTALQDNCFIASSYINFTQLQSLGIITGKESMAERAGWMGVMEFLGLGNPLGFATVAVGMKLTVDQAQLLSAGGGAVGLYVNWKLTPPYSPTTNAVPDISGMTPYDYFQLTSSTQ